ncbi:MAG: membrane lipoprotein lipid attachment site-containing protein [Melioribacteraceae bacterium]|jgi:hypothetical protein|nr:membrane lipoprotein lipid attachment site-containing protein [Melioribacteraceae bacterium]MDD3557220.1 membrane lipoprotein lipid attachment site-containing protein [Melioribacteraceae bacterium]
MKKIIFTFSLILLTLSACSDKQDKPLELFSAEAFAFKLDNSWELNGTTYVRNFAQEENDFGYNHKVSYKIDLVKPNGDSVYILSDEVENNIDERALDIPLEFQTELDSTYAQGKYKIIFNVKDELSGKTGTIETFFELNEY